MEVRRIDHVQLAMPADQADAIAFYEGVLGFPWAPKPPHLAARGGCWFERADLKVHLGVDPEFRPATKAHPALIVDDAAFARAAAGADRVVDDEPLEGYDRIYVHDPFGNRLELLELLGSTRGQYSRGRGPRGPGGRAGCGRASGCSRSGARRTGTGGRRSCPKCVRPGSG